MRPALVTSLLACLLLTGCASYNGVHPVIAVATRTAFTDSGYKPNEGDNLKPALVKLEARLKELQITIEEMPAEEFANGQGNWGSTLPQTRTIWMPVGISPNTRFEVLAHEAAHVYQPLNATQGKGAELFAELVAWEVARYYGHNMTQSSGKYLAGYKEALVYADAYRVDIRRAFVILTGRGEVWN